MKCHVFVSNYVVLFFFFFLKVMCFLGLLQVEFTTLVSLKGGLESTGGMGVSLCFFSQHFLYLLHWRALRELVSLYPVIGNSFLDHIIH